MTDAPNELDDADKIAATIIQTMLFNLTPDVAGAVLGVIMARYLQRHQYKPRDPIKEDRMRRELFSEWEDYVWQMVGLLDSEQMTKQ